MSLKKFIPFSKVDALKRLVTGIVTGEIKDNDGETCRYIPTKKNYEQWASKAQKRSGGVSFGNLREMHDLKAAGLGTALDFHDDDKEIWMTFKVVDDAAWKKVLEKVYTGFSQGGEYVDGPDSEGFYTARPIEVSLVDAPCLEEATIAHIKGAVPQRLMKMAREARVENEAFCIWIDGELDKSAKTKSVAGEDLPASAFAHVGDPEDTSTWKLPIKFSSSEKSASHVRNALARFGQTEGLTAEQKAQAKAKIVAAAREHGIEVSGDKAMEFTQAQLDSLTDVLLAKLGGKVVAKASVHDHMKKAMEHHAKAMGHLVDASRAAEDQEDAGPHIEKAKKAMEMCGKCMGKAAGAMGLDDADVSGGEESGERGEKAAKARAVLVAAGLEGEALEKAVRKATGQPELLTEAAVGNIIEEKMGEFFKAFFGKGEDGNKAAKAAGATDDEPAPAVRQTTRRVTKAEDNADAGELEKLRREVADLKKTVTQGHDPEGAAAALAKDHGEVLSPERALALGIMK